MSNKKKSDGVGEERVAELRKIYLEGGIPALMEEVICAAADRGDHFGRREVRGSKHTD